MRASAAVCVTLAACSFAPGTLAPTIDASVDTVDTLLDPDVAPPGVWLTGFGYRKQVTLTPPALTGSLADFPVGIARATDEDLALHARSDGRDLVVTGADAMSPLIYELAYWDPSSGGFELWVRLPTLPLDAPTTLFLYYGGPATVGTPAATWSSIFTSVWHLSETGTTASDSTTTANQLTVEGTDTSPAAGSGIAGGSRGPSASTDRLSMVDNNTLDFASTSFSVSTWVNQSATNGLYDQPIYKGGTNDCCPGWSLLLGQTSWDFKIHDGGVDNTPGTDWMSASFGDESTFRARWVHLVAVVDRNANTLRTFADGLLTDTQGITNVGPLISNVSFAIGRGSSGAWFNGLVDEARVYNTTLTPEWIATEHANLTSTSFVVVGAETTP